MFQNLEIRGKDASGFWGVQNEGSILYHKEPTKSSVFVNKSIWKEIKNINPNILLCHAREASTGSGLPCDNKNNHPFVNEDLSIALIHNGRVPSNAYKILKNKYQVHTICDSEILLRIFQGGLICKENEFSNEKEEIRSRLLGIRDIWSKAYDSHMSVAIGEIANKERRLWLFRNEHRPSYFIDLREQLGQVFFASTPEIWQNSINSLSLGFHLAEEIPPEEVILFETNGDSIDISRFEVKIEGIQKWSNDGFIEFNKPNFNNIYTNLNENEECELSANNKIKQICSNILSYSFEIEDALEANDELEYEYLINKLSFIESEILIILKNIKK